MAEFATRGQPRGLMRTAFFLLTFLLHSIIARAQVDPNASACLYVEEAFSTCWRRRVATAYTASAVASCVCTVAGRADPLIDSAVPSCTSYLETAGSERQITAYYSSFNNYCSSYAPGDRDGRGGSRSTTVSDENSDLEGLQYCQAVLGIYGLCQQSSEDLITQPEVASCICHDNNGDFTTGFDDLLTPCYDWAKTYETAFATEVSSIFGFCTDYGTVTASDDGPPFTLTSGDDGDLPTSTSATPRRRPTITFSQIDNPASAACETVARIANACRTAPSDPLTRAGVANCICQDPSDPNGGFGTKFDEFLTKCYPYAKTRSPAAASEILSLSGYCTRFADGGKTYTVTSTSDTSTATVTDDVFQTSTGLPAETSGPPSSGSKSEVSIVFVGIIAIAVAMLS